jgi:hypothetical protein
MDTAALRQLSAINYQEVGDLDPHLPFGRIVRNPLGDFRRGG